MADEDDKLSFMDDAAQPAPEPKIAAEGEPQPAPAPEPAAPPAASPEPPQDRHVPVMALLDEREKRQLAQREAEDLRKRLAAYEAQRQQQPPPDFHDDPEARLLMERTQVQEMIWNQRLDTSEMIARQAYGSQAVDQARDAFMQAAQQNPALGVELRRQTHPYDFVVNWHNRQRVIEEVGTDPAAYRAKLEAELREKILAEMQTQPAIAPRPPATLSSAPAAGRAGDARPRGSAFDAAFGG